MDAVQTIIKKSVFFLATTVWLMAPRLSFAQPTFSASNTSVTIGNSVCNDFQNITVASSDPNTPIPFTVGVGYPNGNGNGQWLYASVTAANGNSFGTTSNGTTFSATTGATGTVTLTVGLNRSIGSVTDTGTVTLTPTNGAIAPISITVFYSQNTSCGGNTGQASNGFITISPGNVSLSTGQTGQSSQTLSIQNTTGSPMTFGFSAQPSGSWLTVTANSTTISANGTTPVTVTADASQVSATGTYTGTVTITPQSGFGNSIAIPVTFVVSSGGGGGGNSGGTLTVNGSSSSTFSTSFQQIGGSAPGAQCIPIQDSAAGASSYNYSTSTASGGSWLLANFNISGTTIGLLAASSNACVTISTSNVANSLQSGTYQGAVALTSSSGSTATINVTLNVSAGLAPGITVSPSAVFSFPNQAAGSSALQQQVFSITAASGVGLGTAALTNSSACTTSSWFSMSTPTASGNTESFTVTANPSGLATGVYCAVVTMQSSSGGGFAGGTTYITIILPIGQGTGGNGGNGGGGNGTVSLVQPSALTFMQQSGTSFWTSGREGQAITVTGQQGTNWSASIIYGATGNNSWLNIDSPVTASGTFGSGPVSLVVDLFNGVSALPPSNTAYSATVNINTSSGTYSVPVSLLVTPANTPVLLGLPALATFSASTGNTPTSQVVQVVGSDNTGSATSPPITIGTPTATWITASSNGGNTMTINVNATGQSTGVYYGTIPITASQYANQLNYPVVLVVNGGGSGTVSGALTLSSTALSFTNVTGLISNNLNITAASAISVNSSTSEQSCTNATWLNIGTSSFIANVTNFPLSVTVNPSGINNGTTCTGTISLQTSSGTQTVSVSMTVGTAGGSGNVTVNPTQMTFSYTQGQNTPAAQTATIVNQTSGTAGISFTVAAAVTNSSTNWLQVNATQGTTPYNNPGLSVSVAPTSLAASSTPYTGTVTITPNGGQAQTISVSLTVNSTAVVTATPTTATLNYQLGGTSPTSTIQVSSGGATAAFTATATSQSNFLTVSPTSGSSPATLSLGINSSVLSTLLPGPYTGTVTVNGTSPATGSTTISVTLNVTAPLPTISPNGVTNAASGTPGAVSPGEVISIYGSSLGPAQAVSLNSTTCPSPCTQVPTNMGGVSVIFLPSGISAPLTFVSAGQINAVVPYGVVGSGASQSVEVKYLTQSSNASPITVNTVAPGIFTNNFGTGQAAALEYDPTGTYRGLNSSSNPAGVGWYLVIYMTGEGLLNPQPATGAVTGSNPAVPLAVPTVRIGNQPATVSGYSEAPGFVSGVLQVNVIVPSGAGTGAVNFQLSMASVSSQSNVTVFLQ